MSKHDARGAAKTIASLIKSCPEVKFFVTEAILRELRSFLPEERFREIIFRIRYVPRGFISILADVVHANDSYRALRRKRKTLTTAFLHDILLLKKKNPRYARAFLKLLKNFEFHPYLLEHYQLSRTAAKTLVDSYRELEAARRDAVRLLECYLANYG
jgi:hypothetical protein